MDVFDRERGKRKSISWKNGAFGEGMGGKKEPRGGERETN